MDIAAAAAELNALPAPLRRPALLEVAALGRTLRYAAHDEAGLGWARRAAKALAEAGLCPRLRYVAAEEAEEAGDYRAIAALVLALVDLPGCVPRYIRTFRNAEGGDVIWILVEIRDAQTPRGRGAIVAATAHGAQWVSSSLPGRYAHGIRRLLARQPIEGCSEISDWAAIA